VVSVITPVSYDHTPTLGSTLSSIAWHKAGIMRSHRPAVSGVQAEEARLAIESEARLHEVPLEFVGREWSWSPLATGITIRSVHTDFDPLNVQIGLIGDHQRDNATTAVAALHAIRDRFAVPREVLQSALKSVEWPGRLQILSRQPLVVLDGAHNAASAEVLGQAIDAAFQFQRLLLVIGLTEGKDAPGVLGPLVPRADAIYLTRSHHERSADPVPLGRTVSTTGHAMVHTFSDATSAFESALAAAKPNDLVLITGSLFLVGEALEWWRRSPR